MQLAWKNFASIIADASVPPLPNVVILLFELIPWNPVIIGIPPDLINFNILIFIYHINSWSIL